ncbi:MAG: hypothetical protein J0L88_05290 [Xanthomonadales bacterium]|nr:hypothetical protein [Xanthomonadales bacterium]
MTYDARDRLSTTTYIYDGGTFSYTYDPLDNLRTTQRSPGRNLRHEYSATTGRLTRLYDPASPGTDVIGYGYDARGNATSRTSATGFVPSQSFVVDEGNRVRSTSGTTAMTFTYDGHGRRTRVTEGGSTAVHFYTQAGTFLLKEDPARIGKTQEYYFHLGGRTIARRYPTGPVYIHTDILGSPVAETTPAPATTYFLNTHWEPWGAPVGGPFYSGLRYAGHYTDTSTQLSYMQQRYYDPYAGRFLAVDPVAANAGSFNRYWYANNNPYRFIDPDGRATTCAGGQCTMTADTFDPAKSSGVTSVASPATRAAVEAGVPMMRAREHPETGGVVRKDAQGNEAVHRAAGGAENRDGIPTRGIVADSSVTAVVHGHVEKGYGKSDGMVDTPSANGGYGDTQSLSLTNPVPTATIFKDQVGWHEISNGQLQFSYKEGALSEKQSGQMQKNLDAQQDLFHKK